MDIFTSYATDEKKEEEGFVHFMIPDMTVPGKDPWIQVARYQNTKYLEAVQKSHAKLQARRRAEGLTQKQMDIEGENEMIRILAETLFLDHGNLEFQKTPVERTLEGRMMLLRVKDFKREVVEISMNVENYRREERATDLGNSPAA